MPDPLILALIALAFLVAGIVKGTVGLGLPIVVLVFLAVPLGVTQAVSLMLLPAIATNCWQALAGPHLMPLLRRLWSFLLAAVVGVWLGAGLLAYVSADATLAGLGALLAVYSVWSLRSPQIAAPGAREPVLSPLAGGLGGVAFGVTGIFIVPGILYLQALGLKKNELVQALGITFITLSSTLFGRLLEKGVLTGDLAMVSAGAILPAALGLWLGQRLRHRVPEALFRVLFFRALFLASLYFIASAWLR